MRSNNGLMIPVPFSTPLYWLDKIFNARFLQFNHTIPASGSRLIIFWICIKIRIQTYSGRTKYSAFVPKLSKLSGEYLCPQKTQKAAVFFIRKIFGWRVK
jgi:hypothetical protein